MASHPSRQQSSLLNGLHTELSNLRFLNEYSEVSGGRWEVMLTPTKREDLACIQQKSFTHGSFHNPIHLSTSILDKLGFKLAKSTDTLFQSHQSMQIQSFK
jgi:hypothetical protein